MLYVVCALYKFVTLDDFGSIRPVLFDVMKQHQIRGTLLLAREGINGTVSGTQSAIDALLDWLQQDKRLCPIDVKISYTDKQPFKRTKVKLKKEIVTMGVDDIDPAQSVGTYVEPNEWNALVTDADVLLIDTRNDYEVQVGTFENAISPNTKTFREFPDYVKKHLDPEKHKKVAMFCTGGIRCEKSTAYLKEQGFEEVFHLKGGILKYLEDVPENESTWKGECFVFDDRVTVDHQLNTGSYDQCHACRLPITDGDKESPYYVQGVSCPHCFEQHTPAQKKRFSEREKQMQLAKTRGEHHLGKEVATTVNNRRTAKQAERERQKKVALK